MTDFLADYVEALEDMKQRNAEREKKLAAMRRVSHKGRKRR